jgi:hypothetical protein
MFSPRCDLGRSRKKLLLSVAHSAFMRAAVPSAFAVNVNLNSFHEAQTDRAMVSLRTRSDGLLSSAVQQNQFT